MFPSLALQEETSFLEFFDRFNDLREVGGISPFLLATGGLIGNWLEIILICFYRRAFGTRYGVQGVHTHLQHVASQMEEPAMKKAFDGVSALAFVDSKTSASAVEAKKAKRQLWVLECMKDVSNHLGPDVPLSARSSR